MWCEKHRTCVSWALGVIAIISSCGTALCNKAAGDAPQKNIVFFLVDDLGWADIGVNGSSFYEAPDIDGLAADGMRFTQGYAACPVCSPTRASIMTGRHPVRVNITDWIPGSRSRANQNPRFLHVDDRDNLALEETTLAEVLREAGYATFFAGKWHLGDKGNLPTDQGFDINIGGHHVGSPPGGYYSPWNNPYLKAHHDGEYLTERLTEESIRFLNERDNERPFLLYLSYYNVHTPIQPYKKRLPQYEEKLTQLSDEAPPLEERRGLSRSRQDNAEYASMVAAVDDSVGAVLKSLEDLKLTDSTVVVFFSDNGGLCTLAKPGPTCNLPLRSGKGWLYEGGIREPMIIKAPGVAQPGSVCNVPVISMDFFPTLLELAGLPARPELALDGISLVPVLNGNEGLDHAPLVWHYPHYHGSLWTPGAAIRDGDWKLIEFYEFSDVELYNLASDPGETQNVAAKHPEQRDKLRQKLKEWQISMKASMPQPNPDYDPARPVEHR